ncbi:MAG: TetR-like C-terminal domain-containing protein [Anaerobutyricum sp.]|nr:TetR-like C-terminal domain-containing protein [Anaerobutyricum sp.]
MFFDRNVDFQDNFQYQGEHADFCRILLGENHDKNFIEKLKVLLRDKCFSDWDYLFPNTSPETCAAYYSYILYGCIGIIENWLMNDCKPGAEEMASLTETIILHGILVMEK